MLLTPQNSVSCRLPRKTHNAETVNTQSSSAVCIYNLEMLLMALILTAACCNSESFLVLQITPVSVCIRSLANTRVLVAALLYKNKATILNILG